MATLSAVSPERHSHLSDALEREGCSAPKRQCIGTHLQPKTYRVDTQDSRQRVALPHLLGARDEMRPLRIVDAFHITSPSSRG
jgi:hypothetical protein